MQINNVTSAKILFIMQDSFDHSKDFICPAAAATPPNLQTAPSACGDEAIVAALG